MEGVHLKGKFGITLSYQFIDQSRKRSGTDHVEEVLTPKVSFEESELEIDHHREIRTQNTLMQLDLNYGVTERLTTTVTFPIINERDHEHFDEVGTPHEHFTREDGTSGFGDMQLGIQYVLFVRFRDMLVVGASLELPTGAHTLRGSEGSINEPTIQPGSGSTDLKASLRWSHQVIPQKLETFVSVIHKLNNKNDLDYELGDETVLSGGFNQSVGSALIWSLQVNARHTGRDNFLGEIVSSTGADLVNLTPGLRLAVSPNTFIYGYVPIPIYQNVNEAQLTPKSSLLLGVSTTY